MALQDQINSELNEAMKAKDTLKTGTLRMVKAALLNRKIEVGHELSDAEVMATLTSLIKQRKDSVEQYTQGGRMELASREQAEIEIIEAYLPPAISEADLERIVAEAVTETGASSPKDMGRVMKAVMSKLTGQTVDGKVVSELVRAKLSG